MKVRRKGSQFGLYLDDGTVEVFNMEFEARQRMGELLGSPKKTIIFEDDSEDDNPSVEAQQWADDETDA
jgi:hypothetical protein